MTAETAAIVALALLGLAVGSFLNVCIYRIPLGRSVVSPASRCPQCDTALQWVDNIPVVSYLVLGGRCRKCRAPISMRYPIVELITMVVFLVHYYVFGLDPILVPRLLFASAMIVLFAIDLEHHLLPNVITLPGIVIGFAFSLLLPPGPLSSLIGILIGGVLITLVFSSITGAIIGLGLIATRRGDMKYALPYGTFLALAGLLASLQGDRIAAWYAGMYGY
jgi:leader peptidase (prepilin peptidase) / N-methyltransferase